MKMHAKIIFMASTIFFIMAWMPSYVYAGSNCSNGKVINLETNPLETVKPDPHTEYKYFSKDHFGVEVKSADGGTTKLTVDDMFGTRTDNGKLIYATLLAALLDGSQVELWCIDPNKVADVVWKSN